MLILAMESTAKAASVALVRDGVLVAQSTQCSGLTHSRTLLPMAEDLLKNLGLNREQRDQFLRITDFMDDKNALEAVREVTGNERSREAISRLIDLYNVIEAYGYGEYVSFDLTLLSKYHYYTGVIFKGYTYGTGEAVATGGRYDNLLLHFGKEAAAIGFMIQIDAVMEAIQRQRIRIPLTARIVEIRYTAQNYQESLKKAIQLRREGIRCVLIPEEDKEGK